MSVTSYCATPWRITLPLSQTDWEVNSLPKLAKVLQTLEEMQLDFNSSQSGGKLVSPADMIVLGGCAAIEEAAE
jgi:catalase-peroxidase